MNEDAVREDAVKYELMVIIRPDLGTDAINARLGEIRKLLAAKKGGMTGEIFFEDIWGMRDLAYHIKKNNRGFYAVFDFLHDPTYIRELDTNLTLEPEILRHMIVKLPFAYTPKSFIAVEEEEPKAEEKKEARPVRRKVTVKREEPAEKAAETLKEEKVEEKPKKKETTLEDVDAKLKSIIENPDINF